MHDYSRFSRSSGNPGALCSRVVLTTSMRSVLVCCSETPGVSLPSHPSQNKTRPGPVSEHQTPNPRDWCAAGLGCSPSSRLGLQPQFSWCQLQTVVFSLCQKKQSCKQKKQKHLGKDFQEQQDTESCDRIQWGTKPLLLRP